MCSTLFNSLQTSLKQGSDFFGLIYRYENKMNLLGVLRFRIHFVSIRFFGDNFLAQITRMSMLYAWFMTRYKLLRDRVYSSTTYKEKIRKKMYIFSIFSSRAARLYIKRICPLEIYIPQCLLLNFVWIKSFIWRVDEPESLPMLMWISILIYSETGQISLMDAWLPLSPFSPTSPTNKIRNLCLYAVLTWIEIDKTWIQFLKGKNSWTW